MEKVPDRYGVQIASFRFLWFRCSTVPTEAVTLNTRTSLSHRRGRSGVLRREAGGPTTTLI
jgi:hypothetical protein